MRKYKKLYEAETQKVTYLRNNLQIQQQSENTLREENDRLHELLKNQKYNAETLLSRITELEEINAELKKQIRPTGQCEGCIYSPWHQKCASCVRNPKSIDKFTLK